MQTCMNHRFIDLKGQTFGRLVVLRLRDGRDSWGQAVWVCKCSCGEMTEVVSKHLRRGETKSCGCLQRDAVASRAGNKHQAWKGGRHLTKGGYIIVSAGVNRYKMEHRAVMENSLGRELFPEETVHHLNGIRGDNRAENLELWTGNHARGQRVEDLTSWAVEHLKRYAPERLK
jgi:hypothetical protein